MGATLQLSTCSCAQMPEVGDRLERGGGYGGGGDDSKVIMTNATVSELLYNVIVSCRHARL